VSRYAADTTVSSDRTKGEIEQLLIRHGAEQFMYANSPDRAMIGFVLNNRTIRLIVPLPDRKSDEFNLTPGRGKQRHPQDVQKLWEQAGRARWRALKLMIQAKLEAVAIGVTTIDQEFLAFTVLPDNSTVMESIGPQITRAIESGKMPKLLPGLGT